MALDSVAAERLFLAGEFAEIIRIGLGRSADVNKLDDRVKVVLAHALAYAGALQQADDLASTVLSSSSKEVRSRGELVLGITAERLGRFADALAHFQSATKLAANPLQAAWAKLHRFRMVLEGHPKDELRAMLADTRQTVVAAGTPETSAYLHICVAALEGQRGRLHDLNRHCDIADSLLNKNPNAWLVGSNRANRAGAAWLQCDYVTAKHHLNAVVEIAKRTRNIRLLEVAEGTLGHLAMITGDLDKARTTFEEILTRSTQHGRVETSAADGLARVCLAVQDRLGCAKALALIDGLSTENAAGFLEYHVRWAGLTKARLLLRENDFKSALEWMATLVDGTRTVDDLAFNAALRLLNAQALMAAGEVCAAAINLLEADRAGAVADRQLQPQYYYTAASLVNEACLHHQLAERAHRIWADRGSSSTQLELSTVPFDFKEAGCATRADYTLGGTVDERETAANAIAAAFDLAHSPRLFGAELLGVIRSLECSPDAKIIESGADTESAHDLLSLHLGNEGNRRLTLVCAAPATPAAAVLLGDVMRIGQAALALEKFRREERNRAALWPAGPTEELGGALFLSEEMQSLLDIARRIAATDVPVLITGETGTGKEVLARTIHACSGRASRTFLPFNCTATPREMLDAQLFGYRRGAFTGATDHFPGIIRAASGGTLFLDEIGELSADVQPKLLRFLESSEVHPIGETHPARVDVRVIAATNADLDALMADGRFRDDLFYRLNIVKLPVPPLRDRRVEIPVLANHYLQKYAAECGKQELRLSEETMEYLVLYRWPGNVRQLANEMRRLGALAENGAVLMPEHLSPDIAASRRTVPAAERPPERTELLVRMDQPLAAAVDHLERAMIQQAMARCGGRVEETAEVLGLSRKGLYLKRQRLGLTK